MSPSDKLFSFHITLDRWGRLSPNSLLLVVVFKRTDSKHLAPMLLMIIIDVLFSVSHQSSLSLFLLHNMTSLVPTHIACTSIRSVQFICVLICSRCLHCFLQNFHFKILAIFFKLNSLQILSSILLSESPELAEDMQCSFGETGTLDFVFTMIQPFFVLSFQRDSITFWREKGFVNYQWKKQRNMRYLWLILLTHAQFERLQSRLTE